MVRKPLILTSESAQFGEHEKLLVANFRGIPVVNYLNHICLAGSHDAIHASVELREVGLGLHLVPDHEVLVLDVSPVGSLGSIWILLKLDISVDLVGNI